MGIHLIGGVHGDKDAFVASGTCVPGVSLLTVVGGKIFTPAAPGVYELCYQSGTKDPSVQAGLAHRRLKFDPASNLEDLALEAWGLDYKDVTVGKKPWDTIQAIDRIIRFGDPDPNTDTTITWLKSYYVLMTQTRQRSNMAKKNKKIMDDAAVEAQSTGRAAALAKAR